MTDGLTQHHFTMQDSRVHVLEVDLSQRQFRPVMGDIAFPLNTGHAQARAVEEGAVACGPGGFNIVLYHGLGIQDQPQHALMVDDELWTTGLGAGGYGVLIGPDWVYAQRNRIQVHVWHPNGQAIEVEHVNRGHEGEVVAFTPRGGTNEFPKYRGKHFYVLEPTITPFPKSARLMFVVRTSELPPKVWPKQTVLESTLDLGIAAGDTLKWTQRFGSAELETPTHIVSGWPQLIRDGVSVIDEYELDPTASMGPDNWFVRRNPRTALGHSRDRKTLFMVFVEGRLPNSYRPDAEPSRGLRLKGLVNIGLRFEMDGLVNMDGGGSAFQFTADGGVIPGCYNAAGTIEGQRPAHFSAAVF